MGFIFNGLSGQEVSISLDTTTINNSKAVTGSRVASAGTTTLGTVPAGKVWYIIGISLVGNTFNVGNTAKVNLEGVTYAEIAPTYSANTGLGSESVNINYPFPFAAPKLVATDVVTLVTSGSDITASASVQYIEVDA